MLAKRCPQFSFFGTSLPPNFATFPTGHILSHEVPVGPSQTQHSPTFSKVLIKSHNIYSFWFSNFSYFFLILLDFTAFICCSSRIQGPDCVTHIWLNPPQVVVVPQKSVLKNDPTLSPPWHQKLWSCSGMTLGLYFLYRRNMKLLLPGHSRFSHMPVLS